MTAITLVAILCHTLTGIAAPVCVDEVVPTQLMVAGTSDNPIPLEMSIFACQSGDGLRQAQEWLAGQGQYHGWRISRVKCVQGTYAPSKRT